MTLYYKECGDPDAPLLVFLHGGGVSSWMWDHQVQYFRHYHCVTIDLPEQGKSQETEPFSMQSSAEEVSKIIEKIAHGKKVIVIGFSLGAQVTVQLLSMKPNLIDYAIINSALVRPNAFLENWIRPSIQLTFPLIKNKTFSKLQAKTLYVSEEYFDTYYQETSQMKAETLIRILRANMSFSIPSNFKKATTKILVTVGEKENSMMKRSARDLVAHHSNCTGIIIPQVGHGISLVDPDYFNRMVEKWIEEGALPEDGIMIS